MGPCEHATAHGDTHCVFCEGFTPSNECCCERDGCMGVARTVFVLQFDLLFHLSSIHIISLQFIFYFVRLQVTFNIVCLCTSYLMYTTAVLQ